MLRSCVTHADYLAPPRLEKRLEGFAPVAQASNVTAANPNVYVQPKARSKIAHCAATAGAALITERSDKFMMSALVLTTTTVTWMLQKYKHETYVSQNQHIYAVTSARPGLLPRHQLQRPLQRLDPKPRGS